MSIYCIGQLKKGENEQNVWKKRKIPYRSLFGNRKHIVALSFGCSVITANLR